MGNQCLKDANAAKKDQPQEAKEPEQMAMESMEGQTTMSGQIPMEEPGQDLCHFVQGHPWPYAIQCRTQDCPSWIYLRRSRHLKRCHLCGEEWANSIQEPGHLFLREDQL